MSEMEEKLGQILGNPQMMQQIMSLAQAMNAGQPSDPPAPAPPQAPPAAAGLDLGALQSLAGMARQGGIDANQQSLLKALSPYVSQARLHKLERAMRAAKMANLASSFLNSGGLQLLAGGFSHV